MSLTQLFLQSPKILTLDLCGTLICLGYPQIRRANPNTPSSDGILEVEQKKRVGQTMGVLNPHHLVEPPGGISAQESAPRLGLKKSPHAVGISLGMTRLKRTIGRDQTNHEMQVIDTSPGTIRATRNWENNPTFLGLFCHNHPSSGSCDTFSSEQLAIVHCRRDI